MDSYVDDNERIVFDGLEKLPQQKLYQVDKILVRLVPR
jgi:hypothetical protein